MVLSTVGSVSSPVNPLTDTVPHQDIPQYENVDMITNALPTTELEINTCATYGVIKRLKVIVYAYAYVHNAFMVHITK